ncbi:hypothetical protein A2U01_0063640, partial [Trifolium medium]|nr:hypothetical protein [Trifolium medium]
MCAPNGMSRSRWVQRPMALVSMVTKPPMQMRRFGFSITLSKFSWIKGTRFTGRPWEAQNMINNSSLVTAVS